MRSAVTSRMPNRAVARSETAPFDDELELEVVQGRLAVLGRPPQLRVRDREPRGVGRRRSRSRASRPAASATSFSKATPAARPFSVPLTGAAVAFFAKTLTVSSARSRVGLTFVTTCGCRSATGPRGGEGDRAVEAHHLVRRHGVPVHEGDGEVARLRGGDEDGEGVRSGLRDAGHVDLVEAEGAARLGGVGDLLAVEPGVEAEVDAVEAQPEGLAGRLGRQGELRAVPPGHGERAVRGHLDVREVRAGLVGRARDLPQVHPVVRVGVGAVGHEGRDDGGRHRRAVPARRREAGLRQRLAAGRHLRRGLDGPTLAQLEPQPGRFERPGPGGDEGRQTRCEHAWNRHCAEPDGRGRGRADSRRTARGVHGASLLTSARLRPVAIGRQ